jgi:hypothetical protein
MLLGGLSTIEFHARYSHVTTIMRAIRDKMKAVADALTLAGREFPQESDLRKLLPKVLCGASRDRVEVVADNAL